MHEPRPPLPGHNRIGHLALTGAVALLLGAHAASQAGPPATLEQKAATPRPAKHDNQTPRYMDVSDIFGIPRMEQVTSKHEQPVLRAPSTVTVITRDDIRNSGSRFLTDPLRLVPGLEVQRISSTESNVNQRGYNDVSTAAEGMLGLVDGRQAYNPFLGNTLWDALLVSMDDLDQIEVIRGPGSYLHGPNAMHGVIHYITKSPLDYTEDEVSFSASGGSYRSSIGRLTYVKRDQDAGLKVTAAWDDISPFGDTDNNARDKRFIEVRYARALGTADESKRNSFEVTAGHGQQKLGLLIPQVTVIPATLFENDVQETFVKTNYTNHEFKAQLSWTAFDSTTVPRNNYPQFDLDLDTVDIDLQYSFALIEDHTLTTGTGFRHATFDTSDQDVSAGRHSTNLGWGFFQDEIRFTDELFFTAGVRWDRHSSTGDNISPRLAVVWTPAEEQSLRASFGTGFRNPSLRELSFNMPVTGSGVPGPITISGNRDLEAEQIQSFELGYGGRPMASLKAGVSAFYNRVDNLVAFQALQFFPGTALPSQVGPANQTNEEAFGFELEAEHLVHDSVSVFGNYAYSIRQDRATRTRNRLAPRHKANFGMRFASRRGVSAMLWVNFFDDTELFGITVDEYTTLNGGLSYDFPLLENRAEGRAFLQVYNAFDEDHREHPQGESFGLMMTAGLEVKY